MGLGRAGLGRAGPRGAVDLDGKGDAMATATPASLPVCPRGCEVGLTQRDARVRCVRVCVKCLRRNTPPFAPACLLALLAARPLTEPP